MELSNIFISEKPDWDSIELELREPLYFHSDIFESESDKAKRMALYDNSMDASAYFRFKGGWCCRSVFPD